ncbi:MAG: folylpolyglutamate synthase/dihydrofolate synthase family protein [Pseudomonadota bacterium]
MSASKPNNERPVRSEAALEIERLLELHPRGFDLSLGRVRDLLDKLGNPQDRLPPVIHIAGTNGKGSCAAFCRSLLEAAGHTVHVHTSPHLVNWHERFRIGCSFVADDTLADAVRRVAAANDDAPITVFEILTAVMFLLFSEHPADYAIIEVGLGGRADATNALSKPVVSVIMPIGMDHQAYLGDTIEEIAGEKAGIIKEGVPTIIGHQPYPAARQVLENVAEMMGVEAFVYGQDFFAFEERGRLILQDNTGLIDLALPTLNGRHQITNAAAAIMAARIADPKLNADMLEKGLQSAQWPARLQRLTSGDLVELAPSGSEIWLDGGHNPDAASACAEFMAGREAMDGRPLFLIAAMLNTKDAVGYFTPFEGLVRHVFTVPIVSSEAGILPADLAESALEAGISAEEFASAYEVLDMLGRNWDDSEPSPRILICGSLYLAGEILSENGTPPN